MAIRSQGLEVNKKQSSECKRYGECRVAQAEMLKAVELTSGSH